MKSKKKTYHIRALLFTSANWPSLSVCVLVLCNRSSLRRCAAFARRHATSSRRRYRSAAAFGESVFCKLRNTHCKPVSRACGRGWLRRRGEEGACHAWARRRGLARRRHCNVRRSRSRSGPNRQVRTWAGRACRPVCTCTGC